MHSDLASRRRTTDIPAKPEAGLAEWTSRIKELQRQVDADEEAETKRLEEEIAASRLARMRRSTGRGTSTDLSTTEVAQSLRETSTTPAPAADREQSQSDALKKLMGEGRSSGVSSYARDHSSVPKSSTPSQPISLAAFMGGRATGPRLNRHAPQQDTHDPTQFEQRNITSPHPIFGRGGVAMPGMAGRNRVADRHEDEPPIKPATTPSQDRKSTPSQEGSTALRTLVQSAEERRKSGVPQKPAASPPVDTSNARARTTSIPSAAPVSSSSTPSWKREPLRDHTIPSTTARPTTPGAPARSTTPGAIARSTTPGNQSSSQSIPRSGRHTPTRSTTPAPPSRTESISPLPPPRTPQATSYPAISKSPPTTSTTPGLAKPIQPTPRKSFQGPEIPLAQKPSATYLRTSPAKEPTPSISRLQGRGFVQSMVQASSQSESPSSYSPGTPFGSPSEKTRERKSSVLDRWQHGNDKPPPIIAPKPMPVRKSRTTESSSNPISPTSPTFSPPPAKSIKPDYTGKSLKSVASLPSIAQAAAAQVNTRNGSAKSDVGTDHSSSSGQKRGLGSSTTMISYIKPLKTGDNSPTNNPPSRPASAAASRSRAASPEVDEMGLRTRSRTRSTGGGSEVGRQERQMTGGGTGKPLSHPTKDRARKPRKAKTVTIQAPVKSEPEETPARKVEATAHPMNVATAAVASFDVRNLSSQQAGPLASHDVVTKANQAEDELSVSGPGRRVHFPLDIPASPPKAEKPHSPIRHTRIPSTGNRATVMEVAQALQARDVQHTVQAPEELPEPVAPSTAVGSDVGAAKPDVKSMIAGWGLPQAQPQAPEEVAPPVPPPMERRKSSQEKYSAFSLPTLIEEKTPAQSPAGTLSRDSGRSSLPVIVEVKVAGHPVEPSPGPEEGRIPTTVEEPTQQVPEAVSAPPVVQDKFVHLHHHDGPLPKVDVAALFHEANKPFSPDPDTQTISVEVLSVQGAIATAISKDSHVFYDTEVLAIIHRFKSKTSGLVGTKVWAWRGNKGSVGEREEKKLQELARRYGTSLITVHQYTEPPELVHVLGGRLATRQGLRAHWSAENTAMHLVRSLHGVVYIDELELGIKNLCSGFSYCLSLLETFYVWHGHASIGEERKSALQYAQSLAPSPENIIELVEGESDEDDMFWLILGEGDYAKADYWRYKPSVTFSPRAWRVHADGKSRSALTPALPGSTQDIHASVHIFDCIWEVFVVVGSDARGHRKDIRLALSVADELSAIAAPHRPFTPPVHVLVLPSQIPIDLRLMFRDLDESFLNKNSTPDHMNLLPSALAFEHLQRTSWSKDAVKDADMLPLGLDHIA